MVSSEADEERPLSRIVRARDIIARDITVGIIGELDDGEVHDIEATPAECSAIAEQLAIPEVFALRGRFTLRAGQRGRICGSLHLQASVTQTCVVSLEDFAAAIDDTVKLIFLPADDPEAADDNPESPDEIPYDGTFIDLGAALAEQLALALDPYPRKPDVTLPETAQAATENPFATFFRPGPDAGKPD